MTVVKDIIALMEDIAPQHLAEDWDNSGLQCGDRNWAVKHVIVALDPSPSVIKTACEKNADLLITHHPLIFRPLKNLILDTPVGEIIDLSVRHRLAVFSAHTNLDSVHGGLNDLFAQKIGLKNLTFLSSENDNSLVKLVVYVPVDSYQNLLNAILETEAGVIGDYTCCTFRQKGIGTFKPGDSSKPFAGKANALEEATEFRIETRLQKNQIRGVLDHIRQYHPYETMAYDIYPLHPVESRHGIGRVGELESPTDLGLFSDQVKSAFGLTTLKVSGPLDMKVKKIAVCTGSGSGLMKQFFATDADVFISGDLKFHDAKDAQANYRGLIDVGHFASEALMIDLVADRLGAMIKEKGLDIRVEAFNEEEDPFQYL
ncbi:MAG: Nif3-like dinuclear metal center hexameric protein [Desulfobacteraceae bacterium]|nr:Nif3-like dinuclear metal center hexameric protein [Desulfobacteraceae bacterium]MBC2755935.1 Nif3-like dinuclear metal center hexameric protein [Desulfobacteraceae bacterium]